MLTAPSIWELTARKFETPAPRWDTPGVMARELDPKTVQTPALGLIDQALTELLATPDGRDRKTRIERRVGEIKQLLDALATRPRSLMTADETVERARTYVDSELGKHAITCQDRAGFVVNSLLIPFILSAIRMYESGFATAEDIDSGLVLGAAHPQGPLALADLIGLDTTMAVAQSLYEEFKEPLYAPPPLLQRMVDAGLLGRKTGRGFYTYDA